MNHVCEENLYIYSACTQIVPCTIFKIMWNSMYLTWIVWSSVSYFSFKWGESCLKWKLGEILSLPSWDALGYIDKKSLCWLQLSQYSFTGFLFQEVCGNLCWLLWSLGLLYGVCEGFLRSVFESGCELMQIVFTGQHYFSLQNCIACFNICTGLWIIYILQNLH